MRCRYAAIRGVHTCEDATIRSRLNRLRDTWISTRPFSVACYSEPIEEIETLSSSDMKTTAQCATTGKSTWKVSLRYAEKRARLEHYRLVSVTVKTKSHVWKAVVVDPQPSIAANLASQS